jgi:hypothetical protein
MARSRRWYLRPRLWLEVFLCANLAGLAPDIYLAHSMNYFRRPSEYLPLYFSLAAPPLLLVAILFMGVGARAPVWRGLGYLVGASAVAVGIAGTVLHLESRFFQEWTLHSLVYSAPFAAPLAYAGMGLLLIMNRMVDPDSQEWSLWVLLFALGGFLGNFVFSLTDHAANGFYHATEWIPVASAAVGLTFLLLPLVTAVRCAYVKICALVMLAQGGVGLLGFYYHFAADWQGVEPTLFGNLVCGAPVLAPLLFADLMLLAWIGLWALHCHLPAPATQPA